MINLLAPSDRRELAAARTNTILFRYVLLLIVVIAFLCLEMVAMYFVVNTEKLRNEQIITENEQKATQYADTKKEADTFRSNLSTAKYILGKQVPHTALILTLANNLPADTVLDKIAIDPTTFGTPTILTVKMKSYDQAIKVKTALQQTIFEKKPLFSSVSFQSVAAADAKEGQTTPYPITATYNITYSKAVLAS